MTLLYLLSCRLASSKILRKEDPFSRMIDVVSSYSCVELFLSKKRSVTGFLFFETSTEGLLFRHTRGFLLEMPHYSCVSPRMSWDILVGRPFLVHLIVISVLFSKSFEAWNWLTSPTSNNNSDTDILTVLLNLVSFLVIFLFLDSIR